MPKTRVMLAIEQGIRDLGLPYELGAKPPLVREPQRVPGPRDCSGEIRLMVAAAGVRHVYNRFTHRELPVGRFGGSVVQWECCRNLLDKRYWWRVGHLLFIEPRGNTPGHVAMVIAVTPKSTLPDGRRVVYPTTGWTLEARAGHGVTVVGPGVNLGREWDRCGKLDQLFEEIS